MIETVEVRTCDMCTDKPRTAKETLSITLDGQEYETELCARHRKQIDAVAAEFIPYAHKRTGPPRTGIPGRARGKHKSRGAISRERARAIRTWAAGQNIQCAARGRIAESIVTAYEAAR